MIGTCKIFAVCNEASFAMLNDNLEDVPRSQLLNFVEQLRKFVKCDHPSVHVRPKKKNSFLINGLQQPGVIAGIGYGSRSSFVDLLEDSTKKGTLFILSKILFVYLYSLVISLPKYNLPVAKMGDYQSFLINQKVLRPIEEDNSLQKANIFGSPYRLKVYLNSRSLILFICCDKSFLIDCVTIHFFFFIFLIFFRFLALNFA